jgi:hypothetical protein
MGFSSFFANRQAKKSALEQYQKLVIKVFADAKVTKEEKAELKKFADENGLTESDLKKIHALLTTNIWQNATADQRLTKEETSALNEATSALGVAKEDFGFDQESFNKFSMLALIDKGMLPEIPPDQHDLKVIFKKGEVLHFGAGAQLRKYKMERSSYGYSGSTVSIPIVKGVRYRIGSGRVTSNSKEVLAVDDVGAFWISNQRLGFLGQRKNFAFPHAKIANLALRQEGLFIFKEGKEKPFILALKDYEVPAAILSFIVNKQ